MASEAKSARPDESFDAETQKALEEIDTCQQELDSLNEKASEEILVVEQKYNQLRKPLYQQRNEVIAKIPHFWLTCLTNHPVIGNQLSEDDNKALQSLRKIEVEEHDDIKSGYKIKFHFDDNPYFENKVLTKEFILSSDAGAPSAKSLPIKWKPGKNFVEEAQKTAKPGSKRQLESTSFFQWYLDTEDVISDDISEAIKDELWPNPLQFFLSDAPENGDEEYDEEDDEEEEEEDLDEEDPDDGE